MAEPVAAAITPIPAAEPPVPVEPLAIDAAPAPVSRWAYERTEDKMRGVTSEFATTISTASVDIGSPYGAVHLQLLLRKGPKFGNDVILTLSEGQLRCGVFNGCKIAVRFDDGKVQTFAASESDSPMHPALFVRNVSAFVDKLRGARTLMVEMPTFTAGNRQFELDVGGLEWELYKGKVVRE